MARGNTRKSYPSRTKQSNRNTNRNPTTATPTTSSTTNATATTAATTNSEGAPIWTQPLLKMAEAFNAFIANTNTQEGQQNGIPPPSKKKKGDSNIIMIHG